MSNLIDNNHPTLTRGQSHASVKSRHNTGVTPSDDRLLAYSAYMYFLTKSVQGNGTFVRFWALTRGATVALEAMDPMKKMTAKPARSQEHAGARILYGESDEDVLKQQSAAFKRAGYNVEHAIGRLAIEAALKNGRYEAVVLGHTLSKDDRHHLPYMAKKTNCNVRVLVLHASGKHPAVDFALDSRQGDEAVLDALASLLTLSAAAVA